MMGTLKPFVRIILYIVGGTFALVAAPVAMVAVHDSLYCRYPAADQFQRTILYRKGESRILLKAEAVMNCWFAPDGAYPKAWQATWVEFEDRDAFLTGSQTIFQSGVDFLVQEALSGKITVDRTRREASVSLQFQSSSKFMEPLNGVYALKNARTLPN